MAIALVLCGWVGEAGRPSQNDEMIQSAVKIDSDESATGVSDTTMISFGIGDEVTYDQEPSGLKGFDWLKKGLVGKVTLVSPGFNLVRVTYVVDGKEEEKFEVMDENCPLKKV